VPSLPSVALAKEGACFPFIVHAILKQEYLKKPPKPEPEAQSYLYCKDELTVVSSLA